MVPLFSLKSTNRLLRDTVYVKMYATVTFCVQSTHWVSPEQHSDVALFFIIEFKYRLKIVCAVKNVVEVSSYVGGS